MPAEETTYLVPLTETQLSTIRWALEWVEPTTAEMRTLTADAQHALRCRLDPVDAAITYATA